MTKAEEDIQKIQEGVRLISITSKNCTLCALDKTLLCGPGPSPEDSTPEFLVKMKELRWEWDAEQESWGYYTGHG